MVLTSTAQGPCRPSAELRRERFVDAAREAFFSSGYGATTMSRIAAAVGGSKTTLWTYFPSKEDLFAAVCDDLIERYGCAVTVQIDESAPLAQQLRCFGHALLETIFSPPMLSLQRLVIGEAGRFPELARLFFERGPACGKARLAALLQAAMHRQEIAMGDPVLAASQFVGLLQARSWHRLLLHLDAVCPPEKRAEEVEVAVSAFLCCWAADCAGLDRRE